MANHVFDTELHTAIEWVGMVKSQLGWDDDTKVYSATRAVLHTLRDRLQPMEAIQFAAQLPIILKGVFYEGYNPNRTPEKTIKTPEDFYGEVQERSGQPINGSEATTAVVSVLKQRISQGEIEDVLSNLPKDLKTILL